MKILFLSNLEWTPDMGPEKPDLVARFLKHRSIGAVVVAGDFCPSRQKDACLSALRHACGGLPVALALGNRDYHIGEAWSEDDADQWPGFLRLRRYWNQACVENGIVLLDEGNLDLGEVVIAGGYGHYDLGFAVPDLAFHGTPVTEEHYVHGGIQRRLRRWEDQARQPRRPSLPEMGHLEAEGILARVDAVSEGHRLLIVTHTLPFLELGKVRQPFYQAYVGNRTLGERLARRAARIELLVCGHSPVRRGPMPVGGIRAATIGNAPDGFFGLIYDTRERTVAWCDLPIWSQRNRQVFPHLNQGL